jgi:uncharacterized protein YqfA (UPF0365 family)
MDFTHLSLLAQLPEKAPAILGGVVFALFAIVVVIVIVTYGGIWFQAYMSDANISIWSLVGMSFRRVNSRVIVQAKIMSMQSGIGPERDVFEQHIAVAVGDAPDQRRNSSPPAGREHRIGARHFEQ